MNQTDISFAPVVFALLAIAIFIMGLNWLIRYSLHAPRIPEQGSPAQRGLAYQTVFIRGARNKQLFGWYTRGQIAGVPESCNQRQDIV
ncbi:MAG: hypothetical protein M0Z83_10470 [Betaproteobacteria bacterium]|nr:hypothetical protein [Betaproteobacteria bacterium]